MSYRAPAPIPHTRPLNAVEFVLTMARNPLEIWGQGAFTLPLVRADWLKTPTFIVNDPQMIRHIMVENSQNYVMQPLRQRVLRPILRDGLLTVEGELWRRTRKSMAPVFAPRNTRALASSMLETTRAYTARLSARSGTTVDISTEMTLLTFDILQATLFTGDIAGEPREFSAAVATLLRTMGRVDPLDVLDAPAFIPRMTRVLGRRSLGYFRTLITSTIERRETLLRSRPEAAPRDLLTLLLEVEGLSRTQIEDNIITFIGAGHETTARALAWTLYLLSQVPEELAKVQAELSGLDEDGSDPADWADQLVYTRAALEEAMRLYPPAPSLNRAARDADRVGDTTIPAGATVLILPWVLHRHERLWSNPAVFDPSRFLPENRSKLDRYQYLPFGIGPRVCIGQSFAMQEGVIALAVMLRRLRFEHVGKSDPRPVQKITVQPEGGIPMRIYGRN